VYPSHGSMFVIDISRTGRTSESVVDEMLKRGFFIRAASYTSRRYADRYVRTSFAIPKPLIEQFAVEFPKVFES
jgi:histidinol-phosphate/aromatic aminotransferase/cobyric acid decarboxylase-like protein